MEGSPMSLASPPTQYQLYHALADLGSEPVRIVRAMRVLQDPDPEPAPGPEPGFEPSEADLADYRRWAAEVDRRWWLERLEAEELEAAARDADWQDRVEGLARVTDVDIATVTGCVG